MKFQYRACLLSSMFLLMLLCNSGFTESQENPLPPISRSSAHDEACKILLDHADRYEEIYLHYDGEEREKRLSEEEVGYHHRMTQLTQQKKWTPMQESGTAIRLTFLFGQFQGALNNCKIERDHGNQITVGCDEVKKKKEAMKELCSE